jgi:hypothetical protein
MARLTGIYLASPDTAKQENAHEYSAFCIIDNPSAAGGCRAHRPRAAMISA